MIKANTGLDIEEVFGHGGVIARSFAGYESRPEQLQMARAVREALVRGRHLTVEAGTGVGKSFAYLVPAIDMAYRGAGAGRNSEAAKSGAGQTFDCRQVGADTRARR